MRSYGSSSGRAERERSARSASRGAFRSKSTAATSSITGVTTPIIAEVAAVLFERKAPREALLALLSRSARPEEEPYDLTGTDNA